MLDLLARNQHGTPAIGHNNRIGRARATLMGGANGTRGPGNCGGLRGSGGPAGGTVARRRDRPPTRRKGGSGTPGHSTSCGREHRGRDVVVSSQTLGHRLRLRCRNGEEGGRTSDSVISVFRNAGQPDILKFLCLEGAGQCQLAHGDGLACPRWRSLTCKRSWSL